MKKLSANREAQEIARVIIERDNAQWQARLANVALDVKEQLNETLRAESATNKALHHEIIDKGS